MKELDVVDVRGTVVDVGPHGIIVEFVGPDGEGELAHLSWAQAGLCVRASSPRAT